MALTRHLLTIIMGIQIFGRNKCFDTKKAERFFKERRIKFQYIDLDRYGMSRGEFNSVKSAVGIDALICDKHPRAAIVRSFAYDEDKINEMLEVPSLLVTPVVRNGRKATLGYQPEIWKIWLETDDNK